MADDLSDQNERPDDALERLELAALIQQAVRELPDRLREAMALVYFEGLRLGGRRTVPRHSSRHVAAPVARWPRAAPQRRRTDSAREQANERGTSAPDRRFKSLIDEGEIYQALRESLALRPPPSELIGLFIRRQMASANGSQAVAGGKDARESLREMAQRFTRPSDRASDPNHPVGAVAAAIRRRCRIFRTGRSTSARRRRVSYFHG